MHLNACVALELNSVPCNKQNYWLMVLMIVHSSLYYCNVLINIIPRTERLTIRWAQSIMSANRIMLRYQSGKLSASPTKKIFIKKSVACHLSLLKKGFENSDLNENLIVIED